MLLRAFVITSFYLKRIYIPIKSIFLHLIALHLLQIKYLTNKIFTVTPHNSLKMRKTKVGYLNIQRIIIHAYITELMKDAQTHTHKHTQTNTQKKKTKIYRHSNIK